VYLLLLFKNVSTEVEMTNEKKDRREFLGVAGVAAASGVLAVNSGSQGTAATDGKDAPESYFQPKSYWEERIKAPDDGKKYGWFIDTRRCFGCHGCEVSCKAENDVPLGNYIRQTFFQDVGEYPNVSTLRRRTLH
jgi:hypothetical protein